MHINSIFFIPLVFCMLEEKGDGWSSGRNAFQDDGCPVGTALLPQSGRSRRYFRAGTTICMRFAWDPSATFTLFSTSDTMSLRAGARWDVKITCNVMNKKCMNIEICVKIWLILICFFYNDEEWKKIETKTKLKVGALVCKKKFVMICRKICMKNMHEDIQ